MTSSSEDEQNGGLMAFLQSEYEQGKRQVSNSHMPFNEHRVQQILQEISQLNPESLGLSTEFFNLRTDILTTDELTQGTMHLGRFTQAEFVGLQYLLHEYKLLYELYKNIEPKERQEKSNIPSMILLPLQNSIHNFSLALAQAAAIRESISQNPDAFSDQANPEEETNAIREDGNILGIQVINRIVERLNDDVEKRENLTQREKINRNDLNRVVANLYLEVLQYSQEQGAEMQLR